MRSAKLMGIVNITPDSFSDGGLFYTHEAAVKRGKQMVLEGADYIDIGGESTRPGASLVSEEEELRRVLPVIEMLSKEITVPISIDTMKPRVAALAVKAGATLINDVTGFTNLAMRHVAAETGVDICVMHMQGSPSTMQNQPHYPRGIVEEVIIFFERQIKLLLEAGVSEERIILDPGVGFGKTVEHNHQIIHSIPHFRSLGFRVLIGCSRKSFLRDSLKKESVNVLSATVCMNTIALLSGVDVIRVHDVIEHREVIDLLNVYNECLPEQALELEL